MSDIYDPTTNEPAVYDDDQPLDWRDQVTEHPALSLAIAFGAGLALFTVLSSSRSGSASKPSSSVWSGLKAAAVGLAARQTMRYAQRRFNLPRIF